MQAKEKQFDRSKSDAQATKVEPVKISDFSLEAYHEYSQKLTRAVRTIHAGPNQGFWCTGGCVLPKSFLLVAAT